MVEKTIDKIKKLLRLSKSTNENEAVLALKKAQELALLNNLEISNIEETKEENSVDQIFQDSLLDFKYMRFQTIQIASVLKNHFRVEMYISKTDEHRTIQIVGTKIDVETFKEVFSYVSLFFEQSFKEKYKKYKISEEQDSKKKSILMNDYVLGFVHGLDSILTRQEQELIKNHQIVLWNEKAKKFVDDICKDSRPVKIKRKTYRDEKMMEYGYKDGELAGTKEKPVNFKDDKKKILKNTTKQTTIVLED